MNCVKCNTTIKEGSKFCVKCGEKVALKKYCQYCKAAMNNDDVFCAECGKQATAPKTVMNVGTTETVASIATLKVATDVASPKVLSTGPTRLTKAQSEKLSEAEKKIIPKLKKDQDFILYDNERNLFFMQRDNWSRIEVIKPSDITNPVARFTLPDWFSKKFTAINWNIKRFLFYTNADALIAWGDYAFISIYNGQICWTAADSRSEYDLPGGKANEIIYCGGAPDLELLPNGNVKIRFGGTTEYRLEKGVLIPCI